MEPSPACAYLVREFEGCRLTGYLCPAKIPTVGYGHTGPDVRVGMRISQAEADRLLAADLKAFAAGVTRELGGARTTQNQFDAFVSFAYNIGIGAFGASTALKRHKAGNYAACGDEMTRWNKGGGVVLGGLVRRRAAERALYLGAAA